MGAGVFALPEQPQGYLTDEAHLLNPAELAQLNNYLSQYEQATTRQIFVVAVDSLNGLPIEDVSIRLAEKWKIGKKGKDNGVLLLIAPNEHKMRIEVGYGLEEKLTDAASGEIIREQIAPFFRQNQFAAGILAGLAAITQKIDGTPFQANGVQMPAPPKYNPLSGLFVLFITLLIIVGVLFRMFGAFLPLVLFSSAAGSGWRSSGTGGGSGFWGGDSGGGFSGGGGGSFGGGGASGGW